MISLVRYVGIDIGDSRTGLAVGDPETRLVSPLPVVDVPFALRGGDALIEAIAREIERSVGTRPAPTLIFGLPFNMDGSEGPQAKKVRAIADRIGARLATKPVFQDERLTTADADWQMAGSGLSHKQKKMRRDGIAAATILREYLANTLGPRRSSLDEREP